MRNSYHLINTWSIDALILSSLLIATSRSIAKPPHKVFIASNGDILTVRALLKILLPPFLLELGTPVHATH